MNIYLIYQNSNKDYDTYDSAIVIAENPREARMMHPDGSDGWDGIKEEYFDSWCDAKDVKVKLIGKAKEGLVKQIVCASFNAG